MVSNFEAGGNFFGQGWIFVVEFVLFVVCFTHTPLFFLTSNAGCRWVEKA